MEIDEPIFRSVQQALSFSYLMETVPASQRSQMHQLFMMAPRRIGVHDTIVRSTIRFDDLNPLEVRGQCAMVRAAVQDHLLEPERFAIHARYANQPDKASGVRAMRDAAMPLLSCQDEWPSLSIAWMIFGDAEQAGGITTRSIAQEFGLSQNMVMRDSAKIRQTHHALEVCALDKLRALFIKDRLIDH